MSVVIDGTNGITAPGTETFGDGTALGGATNPIVSMAKGAAGYVQSYIVNNTNGGSSSADIVAYPSNGSDSHGWVDMGITSLAYADTTYTITGPNESYLFGSGPTGTTGTGNLVFGTDNTGTANSIQFYTNGFTQAKSAAKMVIDGATGNVGIGTSSPGAILDVVGTSTTDIFHVRNGTTYFTVGVTGGGASALNAYQTAVGAQQLQLQTTGGSTYIGGNLLVGTTTAQNARLVVETKSGGYILQGTNSNSIQIQVAANGNVQNSNNSYGAISDIKLKENITDTTPKLAQLNQVRVVNYNLKSDPEHKQLGVIAQELEQIFPAMIEETVDRDEEGNDLGTTTKGIKYSVFVPMLIKAMQEQQAILSSQAAVITQLQADVAALKA